jgi:Zn-finger domain-containing protein
MAPRDLSDLEAHFTRQYVSHPFNEAVKAHRIAIAQLGLAAYQNERLPSTDKRFRSGVC